jgi:hypothetical protein
MRKVLIACVMSVVMVAGAHAASVQAGASIGASAHGGATSTIITGRDTATAANFQGNSAAFGNVVAGSNGVQFNAGQSFAGQSVTGVNGKNGFAVANTSSGARGVSFAWIN